MILRWREVGILVGVLFALNVAGLWTAKLLKAENQQALDDKKAMAGFVLIGALTLVFLVTTFLWGRVRPIARVAQDLGAAAVISCLLSVFVGPLLTGESPFAEGAGAFFAKIWTWGGIAIVGSALGYIILVALTADYRSKQLKSFAERKQTAPKRL